MWERRGDAREMGEVSLLEILPVQGREPLDPFSRIFFDTVLVRMKCCVGVWEPEVELEMSAVDFLSGR